MMLLHCRKVYYEERVEAVLEKLKDVRLWGIRGEVD